MAEYHVESFGCRANRADSEAIGAELRRGGLTQAGDAAAADVIVINTCTVTAEADRTARTFLRRVRRRNPRARVLVTGCYAQRAPEEIAALGGVDAILGNSHKALVADRAFELLTSSGAACPSRPAGAFVPVAALTTPEIYVDSLFAHSALEFAEPDSSFTLPAGGQTRPNLPAHGQTRPNLKVQEGCGNRCSFCVIPETRGPSRSLSFEACLSRVKDFVAAGRAELVLSGINLGRWGRDLTPRRSLDQLVSAILTETSLPRLRLSSLEPMDWTAELLALFREHAGSLDPRLARHAHLPLQSGSDAILRVMHRRYRPWHYAEKLRAVRESMPDAAIGADVMVGFPGEQDELFEESFAFIAAQPLTYLHLFPFSARPGTPAWQLHRNTPVPPEKVELRMGRLRELIRAKNLAFRQSFVGRELPAITLETPELERRQGITRALTDNFLKVHLGTGLGTELAAHQFFSNPANLQVRALIQSVNGDGLNGRTIAQSSA